MVRHGECLCRGCRREAVVSAGDVRDRPAAAVRSVVAIAVATSVAVAIASTSIRAEAHTRSRSYSSWSIDGREVSVTFSAPALEVTRLQPADASTAELQRALADHVASTVGVRAGGEPCAPIGRPQALAAEPELVRVQWHWRCERMDADAVVVLTIASFFDQWASHVHYARVRKDDGDFVELLFTDGARSHAIGPAGGGVPETSGVSFLDYVRLGVEHILTGADHVAFLLALLLLCTCVRDVVFMITGFTLGHSLTLSLAGLGLVRPDVPVIGAMIGFTIALVAVENVTVAAGGSRAIARVAALPLAAAALLSVLAGLGPPAATLAGLGLFTVCYLSLAGAPEQIARLRPVVIVLFGLIHGFGFAAVLVEVGLPAARLVPALLGFNAGVELGQLAIVLASWTLGGAVAAWLSASRRRLAFDLASAVLCAAGVFWFVGRAYAFW
jgi:hypothetical protein